MFEDRKWLQCCDGQISTEVYDMHLHRYAFREVREIVDANDDLPASYFLDYFQETCATTQAVAVRRQAETRARVCTLGRLLSEVGDDALLLTPSWWVGLWTDPDPLGLARATADAASRS